MTHNTLQSARAQAFAALQARNPNTDYRKFTLATYSILFGNSDIRQRDMTAQQLEALRLRYIWVSEQLIIYSSR